MFWSKQAVIDAISAHNYVIEEFEGDERCLIGFLVRHPDVPDDAIRVVPFASDDVDDYKIDQEIVAVEVRNLNSDSAGGCQTDDLRIETVYAHVRMAIRKVVQGCHIINTYHEIF